MFVMLRGQRELVSAWVSAAALERAVVVPGEWICYGEPGEKDQVGSVKREVNEVNG